MPTPDPLRGAFALLRPRLPRLVLAGVLGVLSLGSALALAGVSAWLITRAWQMPPILDLAVAVVAVRAFAIARGVLHYCERLAGHDTALRAAGTAREQIYRRLAHGPADTATLLHSGELVSGLGADVDEVADVLVRAILPVSVAAVLAVAATGVIAVISIPAAVVLAVSLLVAGVAAPALAARGAVAAEHVARRHHGDRDVAAVTALEHAAELRLAGRLPDVVAEAQRRQRDWGAAADAAAVPAAWAQAIPTAATAVSVLGAVVAGMAIAPVVAPTTLAVLMLLPLSAFEATTALPDAAVQLTRSRIAARRLLALAPAEPEPPPVPSAEPGRGQTGRLRATDVRTGHRRDVSTRVRVELAPGTRLAVTGPSGAGKTTLLMTLAGLIPPLAGRVDLDGTPLDRIAEPAVRAAVAFFAEDAHIFATTVRDNLLVARGDSTDDRLVAVVDRVGLSGWLAGLPDGLATVLTGGAQSLSAGQRRRLLLARAVLSPARIVLLDEPTEHLDAADSDRMLHGLLDPDGGLFGADRAVVVATHHLPDTLVCERLSVGPVDPVRVG
ncbi:ABC transporter ATP-binding protein [Mycolicibacillus trivialis]|uniref:ABC transporter ATP-binding protein n=1 Tax=Mycolicibacillus trivialis TaxID=1798 RepID=A0A1X2EPN2_9MYCO|nr:thiol reductant ABC exporter subunit CydC [Mycolicibacillus trivialis]ORX08093.1 ABC transporter ATP-binding protein [Mycolicibacillus trivialis]